MLTDAHCHPFDIAPLLPEFENERRRLEVLIAASACGINEFAHNEILSLNADAQNAAPVFLCFGIHPQYLSQIHSLTDADTKIEDLIDFLTNLAEKKQLDAVGEIGFDLFNAAFKETEKEQGQVFKTQLEIALRYELPVVLHVRRAMHKVFAYSKALSKCKAVVFHSWSGTYEEGISLLQHGINAYFSFGNTIILNHKQAIKSCALFPTERILTETDAPYQPRRREAFSTWSDLPLILEASAALRNEAGNKINTDELELIIENNFRKIF